MQLWTGCIAGALVEADYRARLAAAGFTDIEVEPTRVYGREDAAEIVTSSACWHLAVPLVLQPRLSWRKRKTKRFHSSQTNSPKGAVTRRTMGRLMLIRPSRSLTCHQHWA